MRRISTFNEFSVNESDGFGTSPFLLKKVSDIYHYFFNIEKESTSDNIGYHLIVGKYSNQQIIEGAKNSYCVLGLNQVSEEVIDDVAVNKESIPEVNDEKFEVGGNDVSRLMETVSKCLLNYLELNPKISKIHDEIQENLVLRGEGEYTEFMKSIILSYLGDNWSVQDGATKKSILISR